jgi:DNA-binding HxlR family transcriptional regulator
VRSYGQFCALAKALDVIGDRWTMLIVRELMLGGPSRYTDLRNGLPGIATNLLAERLRELEAAGVLTREQAPPPIASTLFRLTPRGERLRPVLHELGLWGIPYMVEGPAPADEFRGRWLAWPAELFLTDGDPNGPPIAIELRTGEEPMVVEAREGHIRTRGGPASDPDLVLTGSPHTILGLLSGQIDVADARGRGLEAEGDLSVLDRVRPASAPEAQGARADASDRLTARTGSL